MAEISGTASISFSDNLQTKVTSLMTFYSPCTLLDVIYQKRETVFHRDIQTPRRQLKIRRAAEYFDEIRGVWVGLVGLFRVLLGINCFRLVWLTNFFNRPQTRLKRIETIYLIMSHDCSSRKDKNCSIEKRQPYQPKLVAVETVDPNRTRPWFHFQVCLNCNLFPASLLLLIW